MFCGFVKAEFVNALFWDDDRKFALSASRRTWLDLSFILRLIFLCLCYLSLWASMKMSPRQTKTKNWTTTWLLSRYCMKHSWYNLARVLSVIKISRGKKTNWSRYGQFADKKDVFKQFFYLLKRTISLIDKKCLVKAQGMVTWILLE